jgi:hypothetical protein
MRFQESASAVFGEVIQEPGHFPSDGHFAVNEDSRSLGNTKCFELVGGKVLYIF